MDTLVWHSRVSVGGIDTFYLEGGPQDAPVVLLPHGYPNYSLCQTHNWMNEIYPLWVEAHGVMIITPVNWYQATTSLKAMIDRLVCADGDNPDPTSTQGKNAKKARRIEMAGWDYPRHLPGPLFSVVVHGTRRVSEIFDEASLTG